MAEIRLVIFYEIWETQTVYYTWINSFSVNNNNKILTMVLICFSFMWLKPIWEANLILQGEKTLCAHLPPYLVKLSARSLWWAIIESSIISFKIKAIHLWVHEPDIRYSAHADVFFGCPLISQQGKLDVLLYFICPVYPFPSTESYCFIV